MSIRVRYAVYIQGDPKEKMIREPGLHWARDRLSPGPDGQKGFTMTQRHAIFPEGPTRHALYDAHGYSPAVRAGDLLFVSGQVGSREDGSPEPTYIAQVERAFDNLRAVLAAAGCTFDDVIDVSTFHTDPEAQLDDLMSVKQRIFPGAPFPTWTAVGVTWLAGFDFEIKVVARIPGA